MLSVTTPTNNPEYLKEAYESLRDQTFPDWEWVIVPNGGATVTDNFGDERVRIVPCPDTGSVSVVKRFACNAARGDVLVELDHDDLLTPTALEQIHDAFAADPDLGMVYSNFAEFFMPDWRPNMYDQIFGWQYREREFFGHKVQEALEFPPTAAMLSTILFAPNHVRAWRAITYWKLGGHDVTLPVADDHDLCLRFYLESKIKHIEDCLYLYRIHGTNTWITKNADVQLLAGEVRDRYIDRVVARWADLEGLPKVDLGAAFNKPEGYIGLDQHGSDVTADASKGLPFADNSVGVIRAFDFLEHLPDKIFTMNEIYRALVPGGWLLSNTPSTDGRGAFQDPTHVSYWNENSFWYYTQANYAAYAPAIKCRFQPHILRTGFDYDWQQANNIPYVKAYLVALKEGMDRVPGLVQI